MLFTIILAEHLHVSIREVMKFSPAEVQLWQAYFLQKNEKSKQPQTKNNKEGKKFNKMLSIDDENSIKLMLGTHYIKD